MQTPSQSQRHHWIILFARRRGFLKMLMTLTREFRLLNQRPLLERAVLRIAEQSHECVGHLGIATRIASLSWLSVTPSTGALHDVGRNKLAGLREPCPSRSPQTVAERLRDWI